MNNFHHTEADQVKHYFTRKTRKTVIVESLVRIDEHSVMRMRGSCVSSLCTALAEAGSPDGKHYYYYQQWSGNVGSDGEIYIIERDTVRHSTWE